MAALESVGGAVVALSEYPAHSFLSSLPARERAELLAMGTGRRYARDQALTRIAEPGNEVFLIISGCVKVFGDSVDGRPILLAVRMAGDLVGELAALDGQRRSATARAAGTVTATVIGSADFRDYLAARPVVSVAVRDSIAARLRESVEHRIEVSSAAPVLQRLARALCMLGEHYGVVVPDGLLVAAPLSQADMSSLIATTEQSVRRALSALRGEQVVRWEYRKTVITDLGRLREIAGVRQPAARERRRS
jgi:CRP-like cAMP-binding protein